MKKPYNYSVKSDETCDVKGCDVLIKLNVAVRVKRRPLTCYAHHQAGQRAARIRTK